MAFMAVRDFKCTLCQQQFPLLAGDLMMPEPFFCDDCLQEVWQLEDEILEKHVAECIEEGETIPVENIIRKINQLKLGGVDVEEIIGQREHDRKGIIN